MVRGEGFGDRDEALKLLGSRSRRAPGMSPSCRSIGRSRRTSTGALAVALEKRHAQTALPDPGPGRRVASGCRRLRRRGRRHNHRPCPLCRGAASGRLRVSNPGCPVSGRSLAVPVATTQERLCRPGGVLRRQGLQKRPPSILSAVSPRRAPRREGADRGRCRARRHNGALAPDAAACGDRDWTRSEALQGPRPTSGAAGVPGGRHGGGSAGRPADFLRRRRVQAGRAPLPEARARHRGASRAPYAEDCLWPRDMP
jgi:hypothetical protein